MCTWVCGIEGIVKMGEGVNTKNNNDLKALIEAVQNNDTNTVRLLIEAGADVNAKDGEGQTPLIFAAIKNAADVAKFLISAKADVNAKNGYGWTALMAASGNYATDVARFLIEAGADVDAKNEFGWTALMFAAYKNATGVAELLIAAGADLNAKTNDGRTALMFAVDNNAACVAELIVEAAVRSDSSVFVVTDKNKIDGNTLNDVDSFRRFVIDKNGDIKFDGRQTPFLDLKSSCGCKAQMDKIMDKNMVNCGCDNVMFINITQSYRTLKSKVVKGRENVYECTRKYWMIRNRARANKANYIVGVADGIVRGVYEFADRLKWKKARYCTELSNDEELRENPEYREYFAFSGKEAALDVQQRYVGKKIDFSFGNNPIIYNF